MTEIAAQLNSEGYRTPKLRKGYTTTSVRKLVSRCGLTSEPIRLGQLEAGEWSLADLTREIQVPADWLHRWALTGRVCCRQIPPRDLWVIWADGQGSTAVAGACSFDGHSGILASRESKRILFITIIIRGLNREATGL